MNPFSDIATKLELFTAFAILCLLVGLSWALSSARQNEKLLQEQLKAEQQVNADLLEKNKAWQGAVAEQNKLIKTAQAQADERAKAVKAAQAKAAEIVKKYTDSIHDIYSYKPTGNDCQDARNVMNSYIEKRQQELRQ